MRSVLGRLAEHLRTKPAVVLAGRILMVLSCRGTDFSSGVAADVVELQLLARVPYVVNAQPQPSVRHSARAPAPYYDQHDARKAAGRGPVLRGVAGGFFAFVNILLELLVE